MKFVIQRVLKATCTIEGEVTGSIEQGYCVLIGVTEGDTQETADKMIRKMVGLRIFADENGKTNLSIKDVGGAMLLISQFTLYANCRKGNRPSFTDAGNPELADALYEYIIEQVRAAGIPVATGRFGADMKIELVNDGPFTIVLDSRDLA